MFQSDKIICVYLSRRGCLTYTQEMLAQLSMPKPIMVVTEDNGPLFQSQHEVYTLKTAKTKAEHLLRSLTIQKQIQSLIEELKKEHGSFELYFPAFHPWNINFLKVAAKEKILSTITIHDYKTHTGERSPFVESLQKKMIRFSNRTVFLTDFVRQQAVSDLGDQEKFVLFPHPIIPATEKQNLTHSTKPSLLFLGRGVAYKGLDLLLTVIENLPIKKLTVAGTQKESVASTKIIAVIDKYLDEVEIGALLATHHILVLPYIEASQSGVLALGIGAGIPMVISKVGGLPEQLPADAAVWVEPNEESLRAGIQKLINEPETYRHIQLALEQINKASKV